MISERTLRKWRREALQYTTERKIESETPRYNDNKKILRLTQELMDIKLLEKKR